MIKLKINGFKVEREATGKDDEILLDAVMSVFQLGEIVAGTKHCSIDEGITLLTDMVTHSQQAYVEGRAKK